MIVRFDIVNGYFRRKTLLLMGCERGVKYRKYKFDLQPSKLE